VLYARDTAYVCIGYAAQTRAIMPLSARFSSSLRPCRGARGGRAIQPPARLVEGEDSDVMTSIQPELWVDEGTVAIAFYQQAFGARVLHVVGDGEEIVAQGAIGEAAFWIAVVGDSSERLVPRAIGASTGRVLLVVDDPDAVYAGAVEAGALEKSAVDLEYGWRVGRVLDPFGHEWEIAKPVMPWPPSAVPA
jgi:PhnB protein